MDGVSLEMSEFATRSAQVMQGKCLLSDTGLTPSCVCSTQPRHSSRSPPKNNLVQLTFQASTIGCSVSTHNSSFPSSAQHYRRIPRSAGNSGPARWRHPYSFAKSINIVLVLLGFHFAPNQDFQRSSILRDHKEIPSLFRSSYTL